MRCLPALLALGCAEPALYPQPVFLDTSGGDTGTLHTDDTADTGPTTGEPALPCSTNGGVAVRLNTTNNAAVSGTMYWRDPTCFEVAYQTLASGATVDQYTFADHVWVFRDADGAYLDHLVLGDDPVTTWVIP